MESVSPVIKGEYEPHEIKLGAGQPQYDELTVLCLNLPGKPVISRWRLSADDLQMVLEGGDIILTQLTFDNPFQPVHLQIIPPEDCPYFVTA